MLWAEAVTKGFTAPIWMTFRQASEHNAHVRKGEKGSLVVYANSITRAEQDDNGEETERAIPGRESGGNRDHQLAVFRMQGENHATTSAESEFERLCRTLGEIGETGMPVEADLVRGETAAPSPAAICGPLPRGAQSPGQAEPAPVPIAESRGERG